MNLEKIFDGFILLTGLGRTEAAKWLSLCQTAMEEILSRLSANAETERYSTLLNSCAAAGAFWKYTVILSAQPASQSFSAGDVKITQNRSDDLSSSARILYEECLKAIGPLLEDRSFVFEEMVQA